MIEAGFAASSDGDYDSVRRVADAVTRPIVLSLARTKEGDLERAIRAVEKAKRPGIHIFIATSDIHLKHKLMMSRQEVIDAAAWAIGYAKKHVDYVEFSAEDASRSDRDYLVQVFGEAIRAGAVTLNVPDTTGYRPPRADRGALSSPDLEHAGGRPRHLERALPQRPRHGRRQLAGRRPGRRPPDRVHGERPRRARRQRLDGGGRDGAEDPQGLLRPRDRRRDRADLPGEPAGLADHRASRSRSTSRSSATTPSPTRPASIRTASSRTRSPTRSCARRASASARIAGARQALRPPRLRRSPAGARDRGARDRHEQGVRALQGARRQEEERLRRGSHVRSSPRRRCASRTATSSRT